MNRRNFVHTAITSSAFALIPKVRGRESNELSIGAIGVGGKGRSDLDQLAKHGKVVALCDISSRKLDYAKRSYSGAVGYSDYRKLIAQWTGKIDVISISSPDHTHAHATQLALKAGMQVFVQSPMAHTVWEARQLRILAKELGACVQVGMQGCAHDGFRQGVEYLQAGGIGQVSEVHVWTNQPTWPQGPIITARPIEQFTVPDELNWDGFLGPSKVRDYHPCYQPYKWRGWRDFGTGAIGDSGMHLLNLPAMGCGLHSPDKVTCLLRAPYHQDTFPGWGTVRFDFPSTSGRISLFWYEGKVGHLSSQTKRVPNIPKSDLFLGKKPTPKGCIIVGSKGTLFSSSHFGTSWEVNLGKKWLIPNELSLPPKSLKRNGRGDSGMKEELVMAIREKNPKLPLANFDYAAWLNEWILLGNVAMAKGGEFRWDEKNFSTGRTDTNSLLTKFYRKGWTVKPA